MKIIIQRICTFLFALCGLLHAVSWAQAPYLNPGGGLPPFFASMEKHEVFVQVELKDDQGRLSKAPKDLPVGLRILAQGAKIRDYHEKTDAKGRAFFLGVPSNPKVQLSISYEAWVDYEGVRYHFGLQGIPKTVNKDALLEDFDPEQRLPENQLTLTIQKPSSTLTGVSIHHNLIEFHPDEESVLVIHEMILRNNSAQLIDLSHQPGGGLELPAPKGAKSPELHQESHEELEIRGASLYYIGAIPPLFEKKIRWYYTLPYRSDRFEWSQAMPVPTTVGMIVAPRYKKNQHQRAFPLSLKAIDEKGEVREVSTGPDRQFHSLRVNQSFAPGEPLRFELYDMPAPSPWKRQALYASLIMVALLIITLALRDGNNQATLSRSHLIIERDRLIKALARMEIALKRKKISQQRYQREKEAITARLVTLYQTIEQVDQTT